MKQSEDYILRLRSTSLWSSRAISVPPFVATVEARFGRELDPARFPAPVLQPSRSLVAADFPTNNSILFGAKSA